MDQLTHTRAFVRLVELGTFSAVARELRVKQSTVSKWIAALEEDLGVQLMERTTRTRRVTEQGRLFYERACEALVAFDAAFAQLRQASPQPRGKLRISVPVVFGQRFLMQPIADFMAQHPHVELEMTFSDHYQNLVQEGLDIALRVGRPVDSSFRTRTLASTGRSLVASPCYLERHGAPAHPEALHLHQCLLHSGLSTGDTWRFTGPDQQVHRAQVQGRFCANHSAALLEMALQGHGIALLADWLVRLPLDHGQLIALLPDYRSPQAPIQALLPPGRHTSPLARLFLEHMAQRLPHIPGLLP